MKTESEIIIALEELKSVYQLSLKNIETAITCISTASMIVDAVKTCHVKQLKRKLNAAPVAPVPPVEVKKIDSKVLIPPPLQIDQESTKTLLCTECGNEFKKLNKEKYCSKQCANKTKNRKYIAKQKIKRAAVKKPAPVPEPAPASVPTMVPSKHNYPDQLKHNFIQTKKEIRIIGEPPDMKKYFD